MVRIQATQRERFGVYILVSATAEWGGSEEDLLSRDEVYDGLRLAEFEKANVKTTPIESFKPELAAFDLSPEACAHLRATVARGGQSRVLGRESVRLLRRVIAALAAIAAKEPTADELAEAERLGAEIGAAAAAEAATPEAEAPS